METRGFVYWATSFVLLACVIFVLFFQIEAKFNKISSFIYSSIWLVIPYILSFVYIRFNKFEKPIEKTYWSLAAVIMSIAGTLFLVDCIFLNPDPQSGIAMMMTPIFQYVILAVFAVIK